MLPVYFPWTYLLALLICVCLPSKFLTVVWTKMGEMRRGVTFTLSATRR